MGSIADLIIDASQKSPSQSDEEFSIETAPDRFFRLHPSTCVVDGHIVCDHEVVRCDAKQLMRLLDHPRARLSYPEAAWLFARISEAAPTFDDRFIAVSNDYAWDREGNELVPMPPMAKTTNNKKTKERLYG